MMKRLKMISVFLFFSCVVFAQENDEFYNRLQAISNTGIEFFNVDGIEITVQKVKADFNEKNIARKFKQFKIKSNQLILSDSAILENNYTLSKEEEYKTLITYSTYYFIENGDNEIVAFTFSSALGFDKEFEHFFIPLVLNNEIPQKVYSTLEIDSINFAGRKIKLGNSCYWKGINNVQCPYYGQMNWSIHNTLENAQQTAEAQFKTLMANIKGSIVSNSSRKVIFEGSEVEAKEIVFDFEGVTSVLVGMSGGKTLTIYYVSAPVRGNYVSCVLSFWNNDAIGQSGLPPLLEKVMKLKN